MLFLTVSTIILLCSSIIHTTNAFTSQSIVSSFIPSSSTAAVLQQRQPHTREAKQLSSAFSVTKNYHQPNRQFRLLVSLSKNNHENGNTNTNNINRDKVRNDLIEFLVKQETTGTDSVAVDVDDFSDRVDSVIATIGGSGGNSGNGGNGGSGPREITFYELRDMLNSRDGGRDGDGEENEESSSSSSRGKNGLDTLRTFDLKPKEVVEYLDRFVIQQTDAKKVLAVAICDHYNHCRRCLLQNEEQREQEGNENNKKSMFDELFKDEQESAGTTEYAKPNVLLAGPTGVGKTYLLKCLARLVGVPYVKADATKFSETGIVGRDAEDLVRDLVDAAEGDTELASMGIIYVDEIDKIAGGGGDSITTTRGSFNTNGVQNNFLKLLEETDVSLSRPGEMSLSLPPGFSSGIPGMGNEEEAKDRIINTRNILFIFSGAFTTLDKDIRRKREQKPFGIEIDTISPNEQQELDGVNGSNNRLFPNKDDINRPAGKGQSYLRYAETADFVRAGLEPEFVGRVPVRVALDSLDASDLKEILSGAEGSVLNQFLRDFEGYGITMDVTNSDDALTDIAEQAVEEGTGARGLVTVLERTLREHKFELPSTSITKFKLDLETVQSPSFALRRLLEQETAGDGAAVCLNDLKRWERQIQNNYGLPDTVHVWLTEEAQNYLIIQSLEADISAYSFVQKTIGSSMLTNVIQRVNELTGQTAFPLSIDVARDPENELRKWLGALVGNDMDNGDEGSNSS